MGELIGIDEQRRWAAAALLGARERLEGLRDLHALRGTQRQVEGARAAREGYEAAQARRADAALERWQAQGAPPTPEVLAAAPAGLRDRYEELLCALTGQEEEGAPWGDNAPGYAWAQARLWWLLPRWERRAPKQGARWTDGAALVVEGVEVARAAAVADPRAGEGETDRYSAAAVWVRRGRGWSPVARSGGGVGWGRWAAAALAGVELEAPGTARKEA